MTTTEECPRIEALSALVDEALEGAPRLELETHAASCALCGATLADLQALRARFAALPALRVGFELAPLVDRRIEAADRARPARPARPARRRAPWWQLMPAAVGTAVALSAGAYLGSVLVAGGGAQGAGARMSAFEAVPPGGICLGPVCDAGR